MKPVEWTSEKDTAEKEHSPGVPPPPPPRNRARCSVLLPRLCLGPLLVQVVGLDSQEEFNAHNAVASLSSLVADELGSLAFEVDLYT